MNVTGTRPELPQLQAVYSDIVELYNAMTEENYMHRPSAKEVLDTVSSFAKPWPFTFYNRYQRDLIKIEIIKNVYWEYKKKRKERKCSFWNVWFKLCNALAEFIVRTIYLSLAALFKNCQET